MERANADALSGVRFARALVYALVDHPEEVRIEVVCGRRNVILDVTVAEDDHGQVIGKCGELAIAIRTLLAAAGGKEHVVYEFHVRSG